MITLVLGILPIILFFIWQGRDQDLHKETGITRGDRSGLVEENIDVHAERPRGFIAPGRKRDGVDQNKILVRSTMRQCMHALDQSNDHTGRYKRMLIHNRGHQKHKETYDDMQTDAQIRPDSESICSLLLAGDHPGSQSPSRRKSMDLSERAHVLAWLQDVRRANKDVTLEAVESTSRLHSRAPGNHLNIMQSYASTCATNDDPSLISYSPKSSATGTSLGHDLLSSDRQGLWHPTKKPVMTLDSSESFCPTAPPRVKMQTYTNSASMSPFTAYFLSRNAAVDGAGHAEEGRGDQEHNTLETHRCGSRKQTKLNETSADRLLSLVAQLSEPHPHQAIAQSDAIPPFRRSMEDLLIEAGL